MKKLLLLLTLVAGLSSVACAQVCTPDSAAFTAGVIVYPSSLFITPGIGFSGTTGILVPDSLDASVYDTLLPPNTYYVYLDSIHIDSVNGTPSGIGTTITPGGVWLYPGQYACLQFSGTTNATPGNYPVAAFGGACVHGNILGYALDSCQAGQLPSPAFFNFSLTVGPALPCIPDSAAQPIYGISPSPDVLPCIVDSAPFYQTLQVRCPLTYDTSVNLGVILYPDPIAIDSIELDSVINLPAGITWVRYPARLRGGQEGCLTFSGTTNAAPGYYLLTWYGTVWATQLPFRGIIPLTHQTITGNMNRYNYVNYYLKVIGAAGDTCVPYVAPNGINNLDPVLNTALDVYPNPSNGVFTLKLNAGSRVSGQVEVIDVTGRVVFSQDVDLIGRQNMSIDISKCSKGIYTVLLKTANGNAARRISID
jgi:hypothetical protein